ncbi:MAG TPA: hypothetical protein VFU21_28415 [Kofleriaceae bacterium]|nr:hypothetical protein [Kofleriaceae bacterium]
MRALFALVAVLVTGVPAARADGSFDDLARKATEVSGAEGLAALFWSQLAQCPQDGDDFTRRQCEGVREARRAKVAATTFLVTADGAIDPQPYNEKAMSIDIAVRACAACKEVELAGERRSIVGRGELKVTGGRVRAPELHTGTRTFKTRAEGKEWATTVAPRLRADFLVRIPAALEPWKEGGASGYRVEVVGFRVVDPCTGVVLWSNPPAGNVVADPSAARCPAPRRRRVK